MPLLVVISGPIASGKSTLARRVAQDLTERAVRAAAIDLDLVHDRRAVASEREEGTASWDAARRAAAAVADSLFADGVTVVIVEGSFLTLDQRDALTTSLTHHTRHLFVTLVVTYEEAIRRAKTDPTRGASRHPAFLRPYYDTALAKLRITPPNDLVIDTEHVSEADAAARITSEILALLHVDRAADRPRA